MHFIDDQNRKWFMLVSANLAFGLINLDKRVVAAALPTNERDLKMYFLLSRLVINSYFFAIAGYVAAGKKLYDIYCHRMVFGTMMLVFGLSFFSLGLCGKLGMPYRL